MTYPKLKPCPKCEQDAISVFKYDSGNCRAECENCTHISPIEGSVLQAIRSHNALPKSPEKAGDELASPLK